MRWWSWRAWRRGLPACVMAVVAGGFAAAPPGSAQVLERHAFSSGATNAVGGGFHLRGTLGEAGFVGRTSGAAFTVGEGFWARAFVSIASDAPAVAGGIPTTNELLQSAPNPFREDTTIGFGLAGPSKVRLRMFDVTGRRVATLVEGEMPAGRHEQRWSGRDDAGHRVASGVYFYRLDIGEAWSQTKRLIKLR